ncbi:hypothetical protein OEZ85_003522 [Tetradesmus obliquus]|uniref:Uncharacterized protein n=1 Tax=Tetradesmus obliquus TaxID=3088 RepID=A0ABY8UCN7_TETOB|nr:hypothetical protein OEZ85_003522 [Tetradesmus obliquus]
MSSYLLKLADIGGHGGGSFDHRDDLSQLGLAMGCGSSSGVRLSSMHIEQHRVLSHLQASYSRCAEPSAQAAVPVTGTGNIMSTADATDIIIADDERVAMVGVEYGFMAWAAGAICLNHLRFTMAAVDGSERVCSVGPSRFPSAHQQPCKGANLQVIAIPEGLTLAGLGGRSGDSWDQISLYVTPWVPGGAEWSPAMHKHYPQPFKQQVRTLLLCLSCWGEEPKADFIGAWMQQQVQLAVQQSSQQAQVQDEGADTALDDDVHAFVMAFDPALADGLPEVDWIEDFWAPEVDVGFFD